MDLREQEYVVVLSKYGNITKAAEALYVSQPTLSIFINRLEKRMGVRLFQRIKKKFVLTLAGELYVKKAKELLFIQDQFHAELSDLTAGYTGHLKVGIHRRRSSYLIPKVLLEFHSIYPNIEVIFKETTSREMEDMLLEGELDLIISNRFFHAERLEIKPVYNDKLLMVVSSSHPIVSKQTNKKGCRHPWVNLKDMRNERFILQKPEQSIQIFLEQVFSFAKISPSRTFIIENLETASQLAAEGYGIAFNMESYARHFKYHKPVSFFEIGDPDFSVSISVAYRKNSYLPTYAVDFISMVESYFKS